jgi:putative NADH-flavin reductase
VRDAAKINDPKASVIEKDIFSLIPKDFAAFDVVVNAFRPLLGQERFQVEAGRVLIQALQGAPETRLIVVGGAGSLYVDEGETIRLFDTTGFPVLYKMSATSQGKNLEDLQNSTGITWTFVSPAIHFNPEGERTGT